MNRIWKFFQYGYLIVALICLVEGITRWNAERSRSYLFLGFAFFIGAVTTVRLRSEIVRREMHRPWVQKLAHATSENS